jgi:transcriptional regulator with XRE-family HTH domain
MPRRPSSSPDSLGAYIRKWRRDHELTVAELADRLGWSRSYLSLVENGIRDVGEKLAGDLARVLGGSPDFYLDWAKAGAADIAETTLLPLARHQIRSAGESPAALNVEVRVADPSTVRLQSGPAPKGGTGSLPVPLVAEGRSLERGSAGSEPEYVSIDAAVLPRGERFVKPFAWRLSPRGAALAPDILSAGDTVVISQEAGEPAGDEIYAVRDRDGTILLSRVQIKDQVLLLVGQDGAVHKALTAQRADPRSFIAGTVAIVIRALHYAVWKPSPAR